MTETVIDNPEITSIEKLKCDNRFIISNGHEVIF